MKKRFLALLAVFLLLVGCQTTRMLVAKAPEQAPIADGECLDGT